MIGKRYYWLMILVGIALLLSGCEPEKESSCNSNCKRFSEMTVGCDGTFVCNTDCMKCRNPDCPEEEDCVCPEEVKQEDPVVEHLQLIHLEGGVYIDQNGNGTQDEGEQTAGEGITINLVDQNCQEDCAPAGSATTDQEGNYSIDVEAEDGQVFRIDIDWENSPSPILPWSLMYDTQGLDITFDNISGSTEQDTEILMQIPVISSGFMIPDELDDPLCTMTRNPAENPAGDIESVAVRFAPDGFWELEIYPVEFIGLDAASVALFVAHGESLWLWHLSPEGELDAGLLDQSSSQGNPEILPSDAVVEISGNSWFFRFPITPPGAAEPLAPCEIRLFHQPVEGGVMTYDSVETGPLMRDKLWFFETWKIRTDQN